MNEDLPPGTLDNKQWLRIFMPTMIWYVSIQQNPWSMSDTELWDALQKVWTTVYWKVVQHQVEIDDPVFYIVSILLPLLFPAGEADICKCQQRLWEWRGKIGLVALSIINSLLDSKRQEFEGKNSDVNSDELKNFESNEERQEFWEDFLQGYKFAYSDWSKEVCDKILLILYMYSQFHQRPAGLFTGPLII